MTFASCYTEFTVSVKDVAVQVKANRFFNSPEILKTTKVGDDRTWRWSNEISFDSKTNMVTPN